MAMFEGMFDGLLRGIFVLLVLAFLLGMAAMWVLPKVWHLLKPLIHGWTA